MATALQFSVGALFAQVFPTGSEIRFFPASDVENLAVPKVWDIHTLPNGEQFQLSLYWRTFRTEIQTPDGPRQFGEAFEFARNSIVRIIEANTPSNSVLEDLLKNRTNSVFLWVPQRARPRGSPYDFSPNEEDLANALRVKEAFGKRFLALDNIEWCYGMNSGDGGDEVRSLESDLGMAMPKNRDEAAAWFERDWDWWFGKYQQAGIPIWSGNAITVNHLEGRKGVSFTGNEMAYDEPWHDPPKMAIARGASRQYGIPWGQYIADAKPIYKGGRPDVRHWVYNRRYLTGPQGGGSSGGGSTGLPHGRRILFHCYMGGVNFLIKENDFESMLSDYDPLTVEKTDPYILAMRELDKTFASPYARMWEEFYTEIVRKQDRGVPYTPVALLRDRNDGFDIHYAKNGRAIGRIPFSPGDEQTRDMLDVLLVAPYRQMRHLGGCGDQRAGNYAGEIYDVLTTDASPSVLGAYRAIVLMGDVRIEPPLAATLKDFVKNGGLLFMVCEQMTPELWKLAGISDTGGKGMESGYRGAYLRASDHYAYFADGDFEYRKVRLDGAEPLFVANEYENRVWPVATINRVGKGAVITSTIPWLHHGPPAKATVDTDGTRSGMHALFPEIMGMISGELVPVKVRGSEVKVMYNRNRNGWVVTLTNEIGLGMEWPWYSYPEFPSVKPAAREQSTAGVVLQPKFEYARVTEWLTGEELARSKDGTVGLVVPPGEVRVVEFHLK